MSNILMLDIETVPGTAYVWSLWGENVPLERLNTPSRVVCWAAKWVGRREVMFDAEWNKGHEHMLAGILLIIYLSIPYHRLGTALTIRWKCCILIRPKK